MPLDWGRLGRVWLAATPRGGERVGEGVAERGGVVGEEPLGPAQHRGRVGEGLEGRRAGAGGHSSGRDQQAAVIIDHVEDLDRGPIGEHPGRVIESPALVGPGRGREPGASRAGRLVGLGGDEPAGLDDPIDRRLRGHRVHPLIPQALRDRRRARVQAGVVELLAGGHHGLFHLEGGLVRHPVRRPRLRHQRSVALSAVAAPQIPKNQVLIP